MVFISLLLPLGILIIFSFLLMKNANLFRLYLALASFVGMIGMVIGFGVIAYEGIKMGVITNDEYIQGSRSYQLQNCEENGIVTTKSVDDSNTKKASPESIEKCKNNARDQLIKERAYQSKDSMISGGVWGTIFLIVFLLHFPFFVRNRKETE